VAAGFNRVVRADAQLRGAPGRGRRHTRRDLAFRDASGVFDDPVDVLVVAEVA
jgi:hypothetical protein